MTKLCPRGKAAAKRKFAVYPSAYANAYASKICAGKIKDPSGKKRKDFKGPKPAGKKDGGKIGFNKGGGADTGKRGELKSKLGVAINKIKRNRPERLTSKDLKKIKQKFQSEKDLPRAMKTDTTTSAYGDAGKGRPVPKYKSGGLSDYYKDLM